MIAKRRLLGYTALLFSSLSIVGCNAAPDEVVKLGSAENALSARAAGLWNPGEQIPVCWLAGGSAADMALVRTRVTDTWQAVANITFTGWGSCPGSGFQGIQITPGTNMVVTGGLGRQSDGITDMELDFSASPETRWTVCTANGLSRTDCIPAAAIHEFGHALSFAHEQNRPDNN